MTKRKIRLGAIALGVSALSLGMLAGSATAGPKGKQIGKLAAKQCQMERKAMGNKAFREAYGRAPFRSCLGVTRPEVRQDLRNSSRECRAERAEIGVEAFREKYGTNRNQRNAFGKCVSQKVRADLRENKSDKVNAARECKAERADETFADSHDGKSFQEHYGANKNGRNAFGKCVSSKATASDTD